MDDLAKYKNFAIDLAKQASTIIRDNFSLEVLAEWKGDGTPVTETDKRINKLVIDSVAKIFPEHDVLGEEESSKSESEYLWVCDPIDGTLPFSHGLKMSTFSLTLVRDGKPIVGVVSDPYSEQIFHAALGQGSFLNDKRITVSNNEHLSGALINMEGPAEFGELLKNIKDAGAHPSLMMSYIFAAKNVATGHFSGSIFGWNFPWDCAAIKILVEEAGGKTSDYDGNDQRYDQKLNGFVASNGLIHDELLEIIDKSGIKTA